MAKQLPHTSSQITRHVHDVSFASTTIIIMGQFWDDIPPHLIKFIRKQHMFWVATAPLSSDGHINLSSKGLEGTFHVIDNKTVWYEDMTGSGACHMSFDSRLTVNVYSQV